MTKYIRRRTLKKSGPSSMRRRGESYSDTIPEMASSTEKEGGFPAKRKIKANNINNNNVRRMFTKIIDYK